MKSLRDYLSESEHAADNPVAGDAFAINIREECLIESVVLESRSDGVVIAADDRMMQLLESYGYTFEQTCTECGMPDCGCGDSAAYSDAADQDPGEYDQEGSMAKDDLNVIVDAARRLMGLLGDNDNMPEWTQSKIDRAADYVDTAADYIASKKTRGMAETALNPRDPQGDLAAKRQALQQMQREPGHDPQALRQRLLDLEKEAKAKGVSEGYAKDPGKLDLTARPTKSQVWARYMAIYDYDGYAGEENSQEMQDLEDYAAQRFGQDMVNDMNSAGYDSYFGRADDPKKPIDQGSGNYTGLGRSPISAKDIKKSGTLNKRATAGTKDRILSRLGKHPEPTLPENAVEKQPSPVARAVLRRILMQHTGLLATHGPERVMNAIDDLADRVNIGPDDEIGSSDVSAYVREVEQALSEQGVAEGGFNDDGSYNTSDDEATDFDEYDFDDTELGEAEVDTSRKNQQHKDFYNQNPHFKRNDRETKSVGNKLATRVNPTSPQQVRKKPATPFGMTEDLQADDGERYRSADDFFGQFEADHFDEEKVSPDGMEVRGYIDGVNVMVWRFNSPRKTSGYGIYDDSGLNEAEYQGRKVPLGKPMRGDVAKSKVYVRDPKTGNVKKVNFGDPNMSIKKSNPARRKSFRARHNCDNPGPRTKARYWSCRAW